MAASFEYESYSESDEEDTSSSDDDSSSSDTESVRSTTSSHGGGEGGASTVYVGAGLPEHTTEQHIRSHFSQYSTYIVSVHMIRDHQTKKFKGFAFVKFVSAEIAEAAITCFNRTKLLGRIIRVSQSADKKPNPKQPKERKPKQEGAKVKPVKVLASGFPNSVLDSAFQAHFASCYLMKVIRHRNQGKVYRVTLLFPDLERANTAVRCFNNTKLLGQYPLKLQLIDKKKKDAKKRERKRGGRKSKPKSRVLVTNIPPTMDIDDIKSLFGKCGDIISCSYTSSNKQEVEIAFGNPTGAQVAIDEFNGNLYHGRRLRVVLPGGAPVNPPQNSPIPLPGPGHLPAGRGAGRGNRKSVQKKPSASHSPPLMPPPSGPPLRPPPSGPPLRPPPSGRPLRPPPSGPPLMPPPSGPPLRPPPSGPPLRPPPLGPPLMPPPSGPPLRPPPSAVPLFATPVSGLPLTNQMAFPQAPPLMAPCPPPQPLIAFPQAPPTSGYPLSAFPSVPQSPPRPLVPTAIPQTPPPAPPMVYPQPNPPAVYPSHAPSMSSSQLTWSSPISVDLYQFVQEHASKEIDTFIGRGGSIDHQNGQLFIRAGDITEVDQFSKLVMNRYSEQQLACSPDQWNALVMAGPTGMRKVDELRLPFSSNPSVVILEKTSPCLHILFVGLKDAMLGAYNHFCASLNKELSVDRLTLLALVELKCDLATKISQQYTVQIDGYHRESTKLYFTGASENVVLAKKDMETYIGRVCKTSLPGSLSPQLVSLATLIFSKPGAKGVILSSDNGAKCVYCCSQEELADCEKLLAKPSTSTIAVDDPSTIDIEMVRSKVDCNTVVVSLKEKAILIVGFDKKHVHQAKKLIQPEVEVKVEPASQALLACTVIQRLYLHNLLEKLPEGEAVKQSLPVTISCEKDGIYITGVTQDREAASHTLLEKVPGQNRSISFTCHKNMYHVIEKHILQPSSASVEWIRDDYDSKPTCFKIVLFSRKAKHVERVRKNLEEITPTSKWAAVQTKDKKTISSTQEAIESRYRCSLTVRPEEKGVIKIAINALTEEEALAAREEINKLTSPASDRDKHVRSSGAASDRDKYIRISGIAMKFLLVKHEAVLKQLKESCREFHYPHFLRKKKAFDIVDQVSIKVVGSPQDKQGAENTIMFLLGSFTESRFDVQCINASFQLETLNSLGRAYEEEKNLLIESQHNPTGTVSFVIYGPDKQGVEELKRALEQVCGAPSAGSFSLDSRLQQASVIQSKVVHSQPRQSPVMSESCSQPKPLPVVSEICSSNPVVNLIFSPSCNLDFYKKAQFLAQKEHVSLEWKKVWSSPCLSLRGANEDVASVKHKIEQVLIPEITEMLGGAQLMVNPLLLPAMTEKFCQRLNNQLKEELCIIATFPRLQKSNSLLKKISFSQRATVVINNGTIIYEACDAVVVPATSDLRHSSGLAKLVSEVGGPMLQIECTDYVQQNGALEPGSSIALGAGFLPCMNVIYTVVPQWYGGNHGAENSIYTVVKECLKRADCLAVKSVAFPSINCGDLLKTPEPVIAAASLTAVRDYLQMNPASRIDTVVFALNNLAEQEAFLSSLSDVYGDSISPPTSPSKSPSTPARPILVPTSPVPDPPPRSDTNPLLSSLAATAVFNAVTKLPGLSKLSSIVNFEFLSKRKSPSARDTPPVPRSSGTAERAESSLQWYWANDHGSYTPYSNEVSIVLSQEYRTNPTGSAVFLVNDTTYWLDFSIMKQTNVDSGYKRKVMYQARSASEPQMQWELVDEPCAKPTGQHRQAPAESDEPTHCVKLYGPEENLEPASKWIGRQLDSRVKNDSLTLPLRLSQRQEENLQRIASKHHVEMQINDSSRQKAVEIRGVDYKVEKAVAEMEHVISNAESSSGPSEDRLPPWWVPSNVTLCVFSVKRGSAEWNQVELKFSSTIAHVRIKTIDRIQNKWLWKRYTQHRSMLKEKNHGLVNEMDLFHGTGDTPPTRIYDSEEGFDMRFSAQGMWGQANYFAVNASYSDSYAHKSNLGYKEIFLAKVLTGDSFSCRSDRSLRMPPLKDSSGVQLGQVRYDTVTGVTGGSQIYMTYDNQKAYPAYLITY